MHLNLTKGEKIRVDDKTLVFSHIAGTDKHTFIEFGTGEVYQYLDDELMSKYLAREVVLNPEEDESHYANTAFYAYPQDHKDEAIRRKAYVDALIEAGIPKPQAKHWPKIIKRAAEKIGEPEGSEPSYLTVRPWLKAYRDSGGDVRSLIPRHCRKGRKKILRSPEEQQFLDKLIDSTDNEHRSSKAKIAKIVEAEYEKVRKHPDFHDWKCPSPRTIYRILDQGNARAKTKKRFGTRAAVDKFDHGGFTPEAHFPMEVVEIDHTWLDLHVVDKQYQVALGRPWITAAIDRYTRMLVGVYIGFEPPSIYSVAQCIKCMVLPKHWLKKAYPDMPLWESYGVPVLIVCDNGREFLSGSFRNMAAALGTTIRLAPVRNPEYKGAIESFLKTVNQVGLSGLPGRAGSNPQDRGDYDAEGKACMSLQDLKQYFFHWLLAEYVWKRHSGINRVPGMFWRESLKKWKPRLPNKVADIDVILSRQDDGTITKKGVVFSKIRYQSAALQELFQNYPKDRKVKLRIDDADLGWIHVIHKSSRDPLPVPALNQNYANGLSYYHHLQIRKNWKLKNEIDEKCEEARTAREEFHRLVEHWMLQDSAKLRKKLARAMKRASSGGQPDEKPRMSGMPTAEEAFNLGEEMMKPANEVGDEPVVPKPNEDDHSPDDIEDFPNYTP